MTVGKIIFVLMLWSALVGAQDSVVPIQKKMAYEFSTRGTAIPLKSLGLMTPGHWLPISFIVPDGSYVKKGDVVARFDSSTAEYELQTLLFEKKVVLQQLKYELNEIDNDRLGKEDKRDSIVDKYNIALATLEKYKLWPLEDDVLKVEGRLRIAKLEYEAAEKEMQKSESRFKRNFISKAELEKTQQELKEKKLELEYAEAELEYEKLPAPESTLKMAELEIENLKLEREDVEYELKELKSLQDIEKTLANNKEKVIEKKLRNQRRDLENTTVKSSVNGYVKHKSYGNEKLGPGSKYFSGFRFVDIPDLESIVFEIYIPEQNRKYFANNDRVKIYVNGLKDKPLDGVIEQINNVPIDVGEKHDMRYGSTAKLTGLKVYRAEIKANKIAAWMRPGMNAEIKLYSSRKMEFPAVPVKYVRIKEEKTYLAIDGVYREVKGFMNQGWFFIESPELNKRITLKGEFKEDIEALKDEDGQGKFMASGEVVPTKSVKVVIPNIMSSRQESKITWLKEEETEVKKGEKILQLDTIDVDKSITSAETALAQSQNQLDKLAKKLDLEKRENIFMIKTESNNIKIREIERDISLRGLNYKATINARLKCLQAKIAYESAVSEDKRLKSKNADFVSKVEFETAARNVKRKKLQLELAELTFAEEKRGATEVQKSRAKMSYALQKISYDNYVKEALFKEEELKNELERLKLRLEKDKFTLSERIKRRENHTIKAPADGLIRYEKVYDNGRIQKISLGVGLHSKMVAMSLPDLSSLTVAVKVPERYFSKVKQGMAVEIRIPSIDEGIFKGRVKVVNYIFESLSSQNSQVGIYSSQEPLGQNIFLVQVDIDMDETQIKPGVIADIYFPFKR